MSTYLEHILEQFAAAQPAIDAELAAADLAPLVDWLQGEPAVPRSANCPYAWFTWLTQALRQPDEDSLAGVTAFSQGVVVTVALTAEDRPALDRAVAQYVPHIIAALERYQDPYRIEGGPFERDPRDESEDSDHFGRYAMLLTVMGDRTRKRVS